MNNCQFDSLVNKNPVLRNLNSVVNVSRHLLDSIANSEKYKCAGACLMVMLARAVVDLSHEVEKLDYVCMAQGKVIPARDEQIEKLQEEISKKEDIIWNLKRTKFGVSSRSKHVVEA